MGRKGIEEEAILDEAAALIAEEGIEGFSLRGLARRLGVRSASLYNHVSSLDDLIARVARRAMDQMNEVLRCAVADKNAQKRFRPSSVHITPMPTIILRCTRLCSHCR